MASGTYTRLDDRALLTVAGEDAREFLQGLISNDVEKIASGHAIYAALLTPQGKYLFDFFVFEFEDALWLDCERARLDDLAKRLRMYKLRARVTIEGPDENLSVFALGGEAEAGNFGGGMVYADPRLAALGARAALPEGGMAALEQAGFMAAGRETYDSLRLSLGVPDGGDLAIESVFPLEAGFDDLNGVDFEKGCYVGQEVTARMKHRGLVRKRLLPIEIDGPPPAPGSAVLLDGKEVGEIRAVGEGRGLAIIRLEQLEAAGDKSFTADGCRVIARKPEWARF